VDGGGQSHWGHVGGGRRGPSVGDRTAEGCQQPSGWSGTATERTKGCTGLPVVAASGGGGVQTEGHQGPSDWCGAVAERTKGQGVGGRSHKGLVRGGDSCLRDKRVNISKEENDPPPLCCGFSVNS
jgi:hypothetical protein